MTSSQTQYGSTAVKAVELALKEGINPVEAWNRAVCETSSKKSSQDKSCPRNAFLGLCEEGLVKGIPSGSYTEPNPNKGYALKAVKILTDSEIKPSVSQLWKLTTGDSIAHNGQIHVVLALADNQFLILNGIEKVN